MALEEDANPKPAVHHSNIRGRPNADNIANDSHHRILVDCPEDVPPLITCPGTVRAVAASSGVCGTTIAASPSVSDCGNITVSSTPPVAEPGGAFLPVGTTTVTATATDSDGNQASCTFTVEVTDTFAPMAICPPAPLNKTTDSNKCSNDLDVEPLVTFVDNCLDELPAGSLSINQPRPVFPLGSTAVTARITDTNSQSAQCDFYVHVVDNQPPVLSTCPADITTTTEQGICDAPVTFQLPSATDNCQAVDGTPNIKLSSSSGDLFPRGTTNVTIIAEDGTGLTDSCSFTVTVLDQEKPKIDCPNDILVETINPTVSITFQAPTVTDNCGKEQITVTVSENSGKTFTTGTNTTITATATDSSGNSAQCQFIVAIKDLRDFQPPVLSACPADITTDTVQGECGAPVTFQVPSATDNFGTPVIHVSTPVGSLFPIGTTEVTITAEDGAGLTDSCSFTVTVLDNQPPTIICPNDIYVETTNPTVPITFQAPTVIDNCGANQVAVTVSENSGKTFTTGTNTTITATATDDSGNSAQCQFIVAIRDLRDTQPPVLSSCPADITKNTVQGACGAPVTFQVPSATDNFGTPAVRVSTPVGSLFPIGMTEVTITAEDGAGFTDSCSFTVTVLDNEPPTIMCPNDIYVETINPTVPITFQAPTVIDNCGSEQVTVTVSENSGKIFTTGTNTTITATATDSSDNSAQCQFIVAIKDLRTTCNGILCLFDDCFSSQTVVEVHGKGSIALDQLEIGDQVHDKDDTFTRVIGFLHHDPSRKADFVQIDTARGLLEISHEHMVFVNTGRLMRASQVQVGDVLEGNITVLQIKVVQSNGVYAPLTESGTLLVNGHFHASSYVAFHTGVLPPTLQHYGAHTFFALRRLVCRWDMELCRDEQYTNGFPVWLYPVIRMVAWSQSYPAVQVCTILFLLPVITTVYLLEQLVLVILSSPCSIGPFLVVALVASSGLVRTKVRGKVAKVKVL